MTKKFKESYLVLACVFVILIYLAPYFIVGQDCLIMIGDNLDSNVTWLKIMSDNVHRFGWNYETAPQIMNGIPKFCLVSQLNFIFLFYYAFPPFIAYVVNLYLMHFIAFAGMVLLLKKIVPKICENQNLALFGTALCFSLLDFWPSGGLSIAGQPLLLYALLKIRGDNFKIYHFFIIAIFPFYSSLVLAGFFILAVLLAWILLDVIREHSLNKRFVMGAFLLASCYAIAENQLIIQTFIRSGFISHRTESLIAGKPFMASIGEVLKLELFGLSSHADVFQYPVILLAMITALFLSRRRYHLEGTRLRIAILVSMIFSFLGGFYHWNGLIAIKEKWAFFRTFDLSRFTFLLPITFYLILFFSLLIILKGIKGRQIVIGLILLTQIGFAFKRNASDQTAYLKIKSIIFSSTKNSLPLSFKQYYSTGLFSRIRREIGLDASQYSVACLGIDPGILLFNGFYTIDAYVSNYPLRYKRAFRKIIKKELEKNEAIRSLFDDFGSMCYLLSSEIGARNVQKNERFKVTGLELNHEALNEIGCHYVISAVEIVNHESNHLAFWKIFEEPESPWRIFVYKIHSQEPSL